MDEMTLLRSVREDVPTPDARRLSDVRARVMADIHQRTADHGAADPGTVRSRTFSARNVLQPKFRPLMLGVGMVATFAVLTAITIAVLPLRNESAAAAEVLNRAADAAMGAGSVEIPEGAWLRVETHETTLGYVTDGSGSYVGAYDWPLVDVTWVPSDTSGEWVRQSYAGKPSVFYGGKAAADAAAADYAVSAHEDEPTLDRAKAGVFTVGELGGGNSAPITEEIAAMPRDPQRLLDHLGADAEEDRSGAVIDAVAQALRSGIVPADLQAAMYQALALLPDVVITDDAADLDGRRGTAIGVQRADGAETDEIIVDPTTGLYLGQRQIQNRTIGAVPAHTVMDWTSVRTEIVFTAP